MLKELLKEVGDNVKIEVVIRNLEGQEVRFYLSENRTVEMFVEDVRRYVIIGRGYSGDTIIATEAINALELLPKGTLELGGPLLRRSPFGEIMDDPSDAGEIQLMGSTAPGPTEYSEPVVTTNLEEQLEQANEEPQLEEDSGEAPDASV